MGDTGKSQASRRVVQRFYRSGGPSNKSLEFFFHDLESDIKNLTLIEIEKLLKQHSKSLRDYEGMSFPEDDGIVIGYSRLISDELNYDRKALALEDDRLISNMTSQLKGVYSKITIGVKSNCGGLFFVYGYGGTGKTYFWRTLSSALRSEVILSSMLPPVE
ncbi:hypothetical protein CASFOL_001603 [Castilleja foliolosa]|uniref:ATP-dependent DNA helicase n=1 Tax=Castilleja foliolosa TaxID=1961234 RepID=A0ABD3EJY5_9LAMI